MEQVLEKVESKQSSAVKSSKLGLAAKMKMTPDEQFAYIQLHKEEILASVKAFDESLSDVDFIEMTDDEIADMVSKDRRERYEASLRH